jgi:hypothetical protein
MKRLSGYKKKRIVYITLLLIAFTANIYGQTGNTLSNPIITGTYSSDFIYYDSQNTSNFSHSYGLRSYSTNDVYYRFTLNKKMEVIMNHCSSALSDTYLYLLDASGNQIDYNDDYSGIGACSKTAHAYLKKELDAGTYYVVSEGYSQNGVISTQISGMFVDLPGDNMQYPVNAGTYNQSFQYSDTQNTVNFTNQHTGRTSNDVFYQFTLNRKMIVTMTHCGSSIDTYMHLLDASGGTLASNDDYSGDGACPSSTYHSFIQKTLEAGTYFIVSEGYNGSGNITTHITGNASEEFGYPDIPNTYSSDPEAVGAAGGAFDVSATGGAGYSIPVAVPRGVGGMQPSLAIVYNSQSGNGIAGWGAGLSGLSAITRAPKDIYHDGVAGGITHSANEAYYLDGQRLIYSSGTVGQEGAIYYPESDPFTQITVHGTYNTTTANTWFEVQASDGMKYYYGNTYSGRQNYTSGSSPRIHAWYLDYVEDPLGNYMTYTYNSYSYCMYPASITYGSNKNESTGLQNTVTFTYENRSNDPQPFVIEENIKGSLSYRLKTITSKTGSSTFRVYELQYNITGDGSATKFSRLTAVTEKNGAGEALKPVKLTWSFLPSFSQSSQTPTVTNSVNSYSDQYFTAADLNGDGISDIISFTPNHTATSPGNAYRTLSQQFISTRQSDGSYQFVASPYPKYLPAEVEIKNTWDQKMNGQSGFNGLGDGRQYLLSPLYLSNGSGKQVIFFVYNHESAGSPIPPQPDTRYPATLYRSGEIPAYTTGDIDNSGKEVIVFIEKGHNNGVYPSKIGRLLTMSNEYGIPQYAWTDFNVSLSSTPEKIFLSDFNSDGLTDLLVFYNGGYTVFWNRGTGSPGTTFSDSRKTTATHIGNVNRIWPGDFNGDGLTDFLMSNTNDANWYFALNNGNGTFVKQLACTLNVYDQTYTDGQFNGRDDDKFDCRIFDFDFDGKSDVVITKAVYDNDGNFLNHWITFNKTHTYWMRSTGTSLTEAGHATSNSDADALSRRYVLGDFNGDGQTELVNYGYNCYNSTNANANPVWRMYRNSGFSAGTGKVTAITDGYGATTSISYASLAGDGF